MPGASSLPQYEAIIAGAGPAACAVAYRLQRDLGLTKIALFERQSEFGGTWSANQYPGVACDVPPRLYSLSFKQKKEWTSFFGPGPEMREYFKGVASAIGIQDKTTFNVVVAKARFDEATATWTVTTRHVETGEEKDHTSRVFVSCVGSLSNPKKIDVPGEFEGTMFHSARWPKGFSCKGKKVVVLGGGCTAVQLVSATSAEAEHMTHVVRGKQWMVPRPVNPLGGPFGQWLTRNIPGFIYLERNVLYLFLETFFLEAVAGKDGEGARRRFAARSKAYIERCGPPEYRHLLLPKPEELQVACKRRIIDSYYVSSLGRPNVELTDERAVRFEGKEVVMASGRRIKADVVICANGFEPLTAASIDVRNGQGVSLAEHYKKHGGAPRAYRSTLSAAMPNYAQPWSVNAATGHTSALVSIEASAALIVNAFRPLFSGPNELSPLERSAGRSVRVKQEAEDVEQLYIHTTMKKLIYTSGCSSWYTDEQGRVTALCPSFQPTFQLRCNYPPFSDFEYRGLAPKQVASATPITRRVASWLRIGAVPDYRPKQPSNVFLRLFSLILGPLAYLWGRLGMRLLRVSAWLVSHVIGWEQPLPWTAYRSGEADGKVYEKQPQKLIR